MAQTQLKERDSNIIFLLMVKVCIDFKKVKSKLHPIQNFKVLFKLFLMIKCKVKFIIILDNLLFKIKTKIKSFNRILYCLEEQQYLFNNRIKIKKFSKLCQLIKKIIKFLLKIK
jgi:hypothetical protein